MVNSGLRPDECKRIEVRDIEVVADGPNKERILHIIVRGKRGVDYAGRVADQRPASQNILTLGFATYLFIPSAKAVGGTASSD